MGDADLAGDEELLMGWRLQSDGEWHGVLDRLGDRRSGVASDAGAFS